MVLVATLATGSSLPDLRIFFKTLQLWNAAQPPTVYLFQDAAVAATSLPYRGIIKAKEALQPYSGKTRAQMERLPGDGGTLWTEFMMQKIALLEWVFSCEPERAATEGVFFFDADICFFGPLPTVPAEASIALSPHLIREADEARYGHFNGGFLWIRDPRALGRWRDACVGSRFFEQAALEVFQGDRGLYEFPIQSNYGWWRLYQGAEPPEMRMRAWGIRRAPEHSGITVDGAPLLSVHTHWSPGQGLDVQGFNSFVVSFLKKLSKAHPPAKEMLRCLGQTP